MKTVFAHKALVSDRGSPGWADDVLVSIDDAGRIASVDRSSSALPDSTIVSMLLPAQANLHSHTFQRAMAGLSEARSPAGRDSFWTWREIMYRFLDVLTPDDIEAIAALAFVEMLESGYGSVAEFHYVHHQPGGTPYASLTELSERIMAAAAATGIGLTLLPVAYAQGGVDGRALAGGQLRFGNDLDRFSRLAQDAAKLIRQSGQDASIGIAPHSLRAVTSADLLALQNLMPERPVHIHIAEQLPEVEEISAFYGKRPVEWALDNLDINDRWCLIHATQMTPDETLRVAKSGAVAGLCPITEASLGDGIFDGARFVEAGGRFGTGSDSNIRISPSEELRMLEYSQRLRDRARAVIADTGKSTGRLLYEKSLAGGAQALGRNSGALEPGKWADMLALDMDAPSLLSLTDDRVLDGWIFAGDRGAVKEVWSAGRHVVRDGQHIARSETVQRYRKRLASIMSQI